MAHFIGPASGEERVPTNHDTSVTSQASTSSDTPITRTKPKKKKGQQRPSPVVSYKAVVRGEDRKDYTVSAYGVGYNTVSESRTEKVAETVHQLGYSKSDVSVALAQLQENDEEVTYSSLIDMSFMIQQKSLESQEFHTSRQKTEEKNPREDEQEANISDGEDSTTGEGVVGPAREDSGEPPDNSQEVFQQKLRMAIEKRKMELRSAIDAMTFQCRVCNCSRATILLLPCGHLANCDDCLMDVRRCPINRCNKVVRGTKEVYFV